MTRSLRCTQAGPWRSRLGHSLASRLREWRGFCRSPGPVGALRAQVVKASSRRLAPSEIRELLHPLGHVPNLFGVAVELAHTPVTRADVNRIVGLGGPWSPPSDTVDYGVMNWRILAVLVQRYSDDAIRDYRTSGVPDWASLLYLPYGITAALAVAFYRIVPEQGNMAATILDTCQEEGIPPEEIPAWYTALNWGWFNPEDAETIINWRNALGVRAVRYAAAGFTLDEANERDRTGGYDPAALDMLAALRRPT